MTEYDGLAILLDNAAHSNNRARLHAAGCRAVNFGASGPHRGMIVILKDIAEFVAELEANGYPVKRCKCCAEPKP